MTAVRIKAFEPEFAVGSAWRLPSGNVVKVAILKNGAITGVYHEADPVVQRRADAVLVLSWKFLRKYGRRVSL